MSQQEIEEKVLRIFTKNRTDPRPVVLDATFEELQLPSLEIICAMFDLEDEFNITIPDGSAETMRSIRDVVTSVAAELSGKPAGHADAKEPGVS